MGLSWRGNTRKGGSKSWFNMSASSRGLHGSASFKPSKNTTLNLGKHGTRATINLGNGLRWTGYNKHKRKKNEVQEQQGPDFFDQCHEHRKFHPVENLAMLVVFIAAIIGMAVGGKDGGAMGLMGILLIVTQLVLNQLARIPFLGMIFGLLCAFTSVIMCFMAVMLLVFSVFTYFPTLGAVLMLVGMIIIVGLFNFFAAFFN